MIIVGTGDGLVELALDGTVERRALPGSDVVAVSGDWAIAGGKVVNLDSGAPVDLPDGLAPRCVQALDGGRALVGTSDARIVTVGGPEGVERDDAFDALPQRSSWTTPWGGPPDTRSLTLGPDGPFAGVHVGGVWRREAGTWVEVVEADADNHQVTYAEDVLAVAAAIGVGVSRDGGDSWHWSDAGLHAPYCRAVAVADGWLLASASTGPGTREAAVYRRPLDDPDAPFTRCGSDDGEGLPASLPHNVDTFELAAEGQLVAVGTPTGEVHLSEDAGASWRTLASALPGVRCVTFAT